MLSRRRRQEQLLLPIVGSILLVFGSSPTVTGFTTVGNNLVKLPSSTTTSTTRFLNYDGPTYENIGRTQRVDAEGSVLGLTENDALTYKNTGNACLELCFDVLPDTRRKDLLKKLQDAWKEDPLTTLKLIFQLGDPRGGKGDRKNNQQALLWLYEHYFESLILNLEKIGTFSYHKNLLDLLVLALEGADTFETRRTIGEEKSIYLREEIHKECVFEFYQSKKNDQKIQELATQRSKNLCVIRGNHLSFEKYDRPLEPPPCVDAKGRPLLQISAELQDQTQEVFSVSLDVLEYLRGIFEKFGKVYDCYMICEKISTENFDSLDDSGPRLIVRSENSVRFKSAAIVMAQEDAQIAIHKLNGEEERPFRGKLFHFQAKNTTNPYLEFLELRDGFRKRIGRKGYWESQELRQAFVTFMEEKDQKLSIQAREIRKSRESTMLRRAEEKYRLDENYRRLYDAVAKYFARGLERERNVMEQGESKDFGGYAKWAPSLKGSHNRRTNICEGIINELDSDRYRYQHLLSLIRRAAEIPESFTGSGEWNLVNYNVMPSLCRQIHGEMYRRHDKERYDSFLNQAVEQAESGERITMMKAGVLLPHTIITRASRDDDRALNTELGLQWLRLVQDVKDKGKLPNALAICDVSGSMVGGRPQPIDVSVALSMLVSDIVSSGPFRNQVITFSAIPELVQLPKPTVDDLPARVSFMRNIHWEMNTDFQAVFEMILGRAIKEKAAPEEMPSILFCFSDMEFDQAADTGNWKTDLELIRSKYARAGYEVPTIVFWNLRDSGSKPASFEEPGVVMLSGFSAGMLKAFLEFRLEDIRAPTPFESMIEMLRFYDDLVVAPEDMGMEDANTCKQDEPGATP